MSALKLREEAPSAVPVEEFVSQPRPSLRIHLELKAGSLLAVLERLQIAGQSPQLMVFHKEESALGRLILDFDKVNEPTAAVLVSWLEQLLGILSVATEWRPARKLGR